MSTSRFVHAVQAHLMLVRAEVAQHILTVYKQEQKVEPITGVSSEGYVGPGQIQSPYTDGRK